VVYLKNCSPILALDYITPLEAFIGRKLDLGYLRRIGYRAYKLVPRLEKPKKLENRVNIRVLLGYKGDYLY